MKHQKSSITRDSDMGLSSGSNETTVTFRIEDKEGQKRAESVQEEPGRQWQRGDMSVYVCTNKT